MNNFRELLCGCLICTLLTGCSGCGEGTADETIAANGADELNDPFQDKDQPQPKEVEIELPTVTLNDDGTVVVEGEPETYEAARGDQLNVSGVIDQPAAKHPSTVAVAIVHYQPDGKFVTCNSKGGFAQDEGGNRYSFNLPVEMRIPKQLPPDEEFGIQVFYGGELILKRELKLK